MNNQDVISTLNELIETCRDGENGFRDAAKDLDDPNVTQVLQSFSRQRAEFAAELQAEVRRLGGDPDTKGHASGTVHRGWMNLKAALTGKDTHAVLAEAERGEDFAKNAYEKALDQELPATVRTIVERQYLQVKEAHDHVRSLRDQYATRK